MSSTIITAIIVDDEPLARQVVREYLSEHGDITVAAECSNGFEAVKAIEEKRPDLLFLDIQMPKLNGFEVLELIGHDLIVIFTTAYDEHALKAFEVHAADYLLKPFSQERFDAALQHARTRLSSAHIVDALVKDNALHAGRPVERILVRDGTQVHIIRTTDIDYMEAQDDYVAIHAKGKRHLKQCTLGSLEEQLNPDLFTRIHRSFIINIQRLAKIEPYAKDSRVAILTDGTRLHVSRAGYAKLKDRL